MDVSNPAAARPQLAHRMAEANGIRLHYVTAGSGPDVLVLLHGWPQTARAWTRLIPCLSDRYTVIAPDLRGAGDSARPMTGYDKKTAAQDVQVLITGLGHRRIELVGHDIGAMVAYAYAAQWPDEVAHLVLAESGLPGFGVEALWAISKPGQFAHMPFFMTPDLPEMLVEGREAAFIEWFIRTHTFDQAAFGEADFRAYAHAYALPGALRAGFDYYRAFWQDQEDNKGFARTKLAMPVLTIGAAMSVGDALEKQARQVADDVRGLVFEDCGHFVPEEQPERLAREITTFFGAR